jgi:ABC-type thiamine transport system substrate-binding protein
MATFELAFVSAGAVVVEQAVATAESDNAEIIKRFLRFIVTPQNRKKISAQNNAKNRSQKQ